MTFGIGTKIANQVEILTYIVDFIFGISLLPYGTYIKSSKSYYTFTFSYNTNI